MGSIQWTDETWNPVTGCSKVSAGCKNCYAEKMAERLQKMGQPNYKDGFAVRTHPHMLGKPLNWKRPRRIFVNSMSDLFHEDVSEEFIGEVFDTMHAANWHQYQVLTKRPERMLAWVLEQYEGAPVGEHIWLGTSVEDARFLHRIETLNKIPALIRFVSFEPLIGPIEHRKAFGPLCGINWIIIGGESGPGARPMEHHWVDFLIDAGANAGCAVFVKQMGSVWARENGAKHPKGGNPDEWPEALRVREFPRVIREQA